jgi:hypothetical protein
MAQKRTVCNGLISRSRGFQRVPFGLHLRFWRGRQSDFKNRGLKAAAAARPPQQVFSIFRRGPAPEGQKLSSGLLTISRCDLVQNPFNRLDCEQQESRNHTDSNSRSFPGCLQHRPACMSHPIFSARFLNARPVFVVRMTAARRGALSKVSLSAFVHLTGITGASRPRRLTFAFWSAILYEEIKFKRRIARNQMPRV